MDDDIVKRLEDFRRMQDEGRAPTEAKAAKIKSQEEESKEMPPEVAKLIGMVLERRKRQ